MPEETKYAYTNGFANGHGNNGLPPESPDGEMFLFTSESVGEGHPGERKAGCGRILRRTIQIVRGRKPSTFTRISRRAPATVAFQF